MYCKELASEAGISAKAMTTRPEADQGWQEVFGVRLSWRETKKKKARRAAGRAAGARGARGAGAGARGARGAAGGAREGVEGEVAQVSHVGFVARRAAGVFPVAGRDREAEGGDKTEVFGGGRLQHPFGMFCTDWFQAQDRPKQSCRLDTSSSVDEIVHSWAILPSARKSRSRNPPA
eukprot:gene21214-23300_t